MTIESTDEWVLQRIATLLGGAYSTNTPRQEHHKVSYAWRAKGARAIDLMEVLRPLMGARRQQKIDKAMRSAGPSRITNALRREVLDLKTGDPTLTAKALATSLHRSRTTIGNILSSNDRGWAPAPEWQMLAPTLQRIWLAGYLEGEGSFSARAKGAHVSVGATDADIIHRAGRLMGCLRISLHAPAKEHWNEMHRADLGGRAATALMIETYPHMSPRRQSTIVEKLRQVQDTLSAIDEREQQRGVTRMQAESIRARVAAGETQASLALEHGVSRPAISQIVNKVNHRDDQEDRWGNRDQQRHDIARFLQSSDS